MLRRLVDNERGSAIVLFALALTALCGMAGLVVDVGYLYVQHARLQNGVDAACLAGAAFLPDTTTASTTASSYASLNGLNVSALASNFPSNNKIRVTYTEAFGTFFMRVLGYNSVSINVVAAAARPVMPNDPDLVGFDPNRISVVINGNNLDINGSVQSNGQYRMNGWVDISGSANSSGSFLPNSLGTNVTVHGETMQNVPYIELPDYSAQINALPTQTYDSSQRFNGNNFSIDGTISVNGNVDINGNHISGNGSILATGDIHNNGNAITSSGGGPTFIYSSDGNIHINGNNITIDAILFAPHGDIVINGNNITINGRILGNTVTINGSGITLNGSGGSGTMLGSPQLVE